MISGELFASAATTATLIKHFRHPVVTHRRLLVHDGGFSVNSLVAIVTVSHAPFLFGECPLPLGDFALVCRGPTTGFVPWSAFSGHPAQIARSGAFLRARNGRYGVATQVACQTLWSGAGSP